MNRSKRALAHLQQIAEKAAARAAAPGPYRWGIYRCGCEITGADPAAPLPCRCPDHDARLICTQSDAPPPAGGPLGPDSAGPKKLE